MKYSEYGDSRGELVVYFHGAPGAADEAAMFESSAKQYQLRVICFDRFDQDSSLDANGYYEAMAATIKSLVSHGAKVNIVGFSIGAYIALEVALRLPEQLGQVHLVSAPAPLNEGEFIDNMAGGKVFKLAQKSPKLFSLLTQYQTFLARVSPGLLRKLLFASAKAEDKVLSLENDFQQFITPLLKQCFLTRSKGYIRDVRYYVNWVATESDFTHLSAPVYLWHGAQDNWSPVAMADYLEVSIPAVEHKMIMPGLSHYSCLYAAVPQVCRAIIGRKDN